MKPGRVMSFSHSSGSAARTASSGRSGSDGRTTDVSIYDQDQVVVIEGDTRSTAHWVDPIAPPHGWPLYPDGLAELVATASS
jgi:hypothetical protein